MQHHNINVNGINLHYVKAGSGKKLVVLIHGWPEFWYSWRAQIEELSKQYTVVAPDLRGFNKSDKPKGIKNYTMELVSKDIVELIKKLGYEKAHIVGHDWGGSVAWTLGMHHSEVVDKLAVLNCPHPGVFLKELRSNFKQLQKSWYMFFFQLPVLPEWYLKRDLFKTFKNAFRGWAYNKSAFDDNTINKYVEAYSQKGALTSSLNYYRAALQLGAKSRKQRNKKIIVPTRLIWGENDKALGIEMTYNMEKFFENEFEVKYIPNCSHWVQQDEPQKVNEYLLEFLN